MRNKKTHLKSRLKNNSRSLKIGFYSPYLDTYGGGERYMLTLASHLSKDHSVDIFWDNLAIKATLARFLKIDLAKVNLKENIFSKNLIYKLFKTLEYDLIFVQSDGSIPAVLSPKNILNIQVPFNFDPPSIITKIKLKRFQQIVVYSYFTKKYVDKSFETDSKVIYPPVDLESIKPGLKENIILSVGRFSQSHLHHKRQEVLIDVFKELSKEVKNWKLILVGQAKKEDQKFVRSLRKLSQGFAIRIIPNLPIDQLRQIYSHASIYWHATGFGKDELKFPEKMEHFGIATVEACAAGAVPVVINKGGQKEIVTQGKNGFLWDTKIQLYDKTLSLINNKNLLTKLSYSAQVQSRKFSKEKFIREYEKIIFL